MALIYDMADTWNAGATTFTAIKLNVTDTASAAASLLMDLQVGGVSRFRASKSAGMYFDANVTEQRNATTAQAFRLYNTYTDASNYERGFMRWAGNVLEIGPEAAGTGTTRASQFGNSNCRMSVDIGTTINFLVGAGSSTQLSIKNSNRIGMNSGTLFGFTSSATSADPFNLLDVVLRRVGAGILGVRSSGDGSTGAAVSLIEQTAPAAPATDGVYIYAEDNGGGKTRLMARFATGAAVQIAIEP